MCEVVALEIGPDRPGQAPFVTAIMRHVVSNIRQAESATEDHAAIPPESEKSETKHRRENWQRDERWCQPAAGIIGVEVVGAMHHETEARRAGEISIKMKYEAVEHVFEQGPYKERCRDKARHFCSAERAIRDAQREQACT